MNIPFLLFIVLACYLAWRVMRSSRIKEESPEGVIAAVMENYDATETDVQLSQFSAFTENYNPRLIKALCINENVSICFVEYTFVIKNKTRYSPADDTSVYAFYLVNKGVFDRQQFNDRLDTFEVRENHVLIRFDRVPVNKYKTLEEIEKLLVQTSALSH